MLHSNRSQHHLSNEQIIDIESTIDAMSMQEESCYLIDDYFRDLPTHSSGGFFPVDVDAREEIAKWCIRIIQALGCENCIAEILMSCLDRFVSTENGKTILLDRHEYQLAALTALYSSIKTHNQTALSLEFVAKLSRDEYSKRDIEAMERRMLDAIQWRVNPPTAIDFVHKYLEMSLVWNWLDLPTQDILLELVEYQINLSVIDFEISTFKASHIAIASLLNASKSICPTERDLHESILDIIFSCGVDEESLETLQRKLYKGMVQGNYGKIRAHNESMCGQSVETKSNSSVAPDSPRAVYECNRGAIV